MTKCLLALSSSSILGAAVEHILSSTDNLELVSLPIHDRSGLVDGIQQARPDVVIVECDGLGGENFLAGLTTTQPGLLIIQINSKDNQLKTYQHHHFSIHNTSELIGLIQSE